MASGTVRVFGLALVAVALAASACSSSDSDEPTPVRLYVATEQDEHPWTGLLLPPQVPVVVPPPPPEVVEDNGDPVAGGTGTPAVAGDAAALYGGSLERQLCDTNRLVDNLETDDAKARAWKDTLAVEDIRRYVESLSPVLLRADTRVTVFEYRDGAARPVQSLLENGTIVLVDEFGVPRVRCARGNPLAAPVLSGNDELEGPAWPDLNPDRLFVVRPAAEPVEELTVVDITTGAMLPVPVGAEAAPEPEIAAAPEPEPSTPEPQSAPVPQQPANPAPPPPPPPPPPPAPEPPPPPPPAVDIPPPPPPAAPAPPARPAPPPPPQIQIPIPGGPPVVIPLPF